MSTAEMEPDYPLTRDYIDIARLNLQHYLMTDMFGYLLHPTVAGQGNKELKIADAGCGTAIWSTSLAAILPPTVEIVGLDITLDQAPPADYLPPNLSLRIWDMFGDVPEDLVGYFDVVHTRMMLCVTNNPVKLLTNLLRLLKPGGWIQWGELDAVSMRIETPSGIVTDGILKELWKRVSAASSAVMPTWTSDMLSVFDAAGCQEITVSTIRPRRDLEFAMHGCSLLIYDLFAQTSKHASEAQKKEVSEFVSRAAAEAKTGTMFSFKRSTAIGRKPFVRQEKTA